ncbi:hypothetical protein [Methanobacterium ferruginis]|jgi:uncharacterized membrane protein|uniref:hypothetical protein n=1 Tax=Methanobacterium ferruginis TaxID=710191 RepID=UPI0025724488|nr:hypothetical protein [Methanobacterium ferruginis]BDZ66756.1 hypothetical protein GCM10025860_02040 [Methanobacterium ferruginis]
MDDKISGIIMAVLGVLLGILYFALPNLLIYAYWAAVIILVVYGLYLYLKN